jgi:hypothetical protein
MDIQKAFDILEIDLKTIKLADLTQEYIKKRYHRLALINHPDKNGNTIESTNKFQLINEAYEYLLEELHTITELNDNQNYNQNKNNMNTFDSFVSSSNVEDQKSRYIYLLSIFIGSIIEGDFKESIKNVIKEIVIGYKNISLETIFDGLDKDSALEVYSFICKYRHILYVSNETLEFVSLLIKQKYKNDRVFILNPSINDLMDNNIFKLYVDDQLYLVPLWHNELYFDSPNGDIIVLCNPELPEGIIIDEDNNIHIEKDINGSLSLLDLLKEDSNSFVSLSIGEKIFRIPLQSLHIKKEQMYRLVGEGISNVLENDMYNVSCKADIIVKIVIK